MAELRSLARYCKFGASLNDLLRDRIVCGINDENIQRRLLAEKTLTLDSALDIAVGMESARKNVTELQTPVQKPTEVYKVTTTNCYRCGNSGHTPDRCRFRHVKCLTCGKTGHIQRVCRSGPPRSDRLPAGTEKSTSKSRRNHRPRPVRQLTQWQEQEGLDLEEFIKHLGKSENAIELEVYIEGKLVNMELDTGASVSLISEATWSKLYSKKKLQRTTTILRTYTGEKIQPLGSCNVEVKYKEESAILPLLVIKGNSPNLFGRNGLQYTQIDWNSIHMVCNDNLQNILAKHRNVFGKGLGHLGGYNAKYMLSKRLYQNL